MKPFKFPPQTVRSSVRPEPQVYLPPHPSGHFSTLAPARKTSRLGPLIGSNETTKLTAIPRTVLKLRRWLLQSAVAPSFYLLIGPHFATAAPASVPAPHKAKSAGATPDKKIDALFKEWDSEPPGASVPIKPDTVFHVASVSKQFTAMAVVLLELDGKLSIDDDIHKYLPELPDYGAKITLRNLLFVKDATANINSVTLGGQGCRRRLHAKTRSDDSRGRAAKIGESLTRMRRSEVVPSRATGETT